MAVFRPVHTQFHQFRPKVFVGVDFVPEPEPPTAGTGASSRRMIPSLPTPRLSTARNVQVQLTANLGRLTAQAGTRIEFADEELIELL